MACRNGYPLDLNPGLNFTRIYGQKVIKPYPSMIGHIPVISPLLDLVAAPAARPFPWGGSNVINGVPPPGSAFVQITFPQIPKVKG